MSLDPSSSYEADICLVLEGTYPYVVGGVSSWVHTLIKGLPEFTFSLVVLLADRKEREVRYELPENIQHLHHVYLQDKSIFKKPWSPKALPPSVFEPLKAFHQEMPKIHDADKQAYDGHALFQKVITQLYQTHWNPSDLLYARDNWDFVVEQYEEHNNEESFLDYVWTWRFLHVGFFNTLHADIPKCRLYHSVSTGYAGLYGTYASAVTQHPLLLTEHGIYSKERKLEIARANWIFERSKERFRAEQGMSRFKEIWVNAFQVLSKVCYDQASEIVTLYSGNQELQRNEGANPQKMRVIPNGVYYERLSNLTPNPQNPPIIGFVGRISSIKDVKTFIRSIRKVANHQPHIQVLLMGPTDEEPEYYEECVQLVEALELSDLITFTGNVNLMEYYPKLSLLVLTSLSEGQPLVILEAQSLAIPVVASDVGSCRELLEGFTDEDVALGASGIVTGIASSEETADAILALLENTALAQQMGEAGKKRMQRFYDMPLLYDRYRELYQSHL